MTQNYHDPIVVGESNSPATINTRLGTLDSAIGTTVASLVALTGALDDRIDDLIVDNGTSDAEVIAARTTLPYKAGSPPATLGAALALIAGNIANVKAFGATGDGVTDDSTAIQAALTAHTVVYFPPGTYVTNTTLTTGEGRTLIGYGATLKVGSATPLNINGSNVRVEGLRFLGTATNHTTRATGGTGLLIDATASRENIRLHGCVFEWLGTGISFTSPSVVDNSIVLQNLAFEHCTFRDLNQHAIAVKKSGVSARTNFNICRWRITDCDFEDVYYTSTYNPDGVIYLSSGIVVENLILANCNARNCLTAWLAVASGSGGTGMAHVDGCTITGCAINGAPPSGATWYALMGIDIANVTRLSVAGCLFENIDIECLALYGCEHFSVTGCTFEGSAYGVAVYGNGAAGCSGTVAGCTFVDLVRPTTSSNGSGVFISEDVEHRVKVTGCTFKGGGNGVHVATRAQPATVVSGCEFVGCARGVFGANTPTHQFVVQGCFFSGCTTAGIQAASVLGASTIANCLFIGCADDILASTSSHVRCISNTHTNTTGTAVKLQNATWNAISGCIFVDCAAAHAGTGIVGANNQVIWQNNLYIGTTPVPATNAWYSIVNQQGQRIVYGNAAPVGGAWVQGDMLIDATPTAGATWGWMCTAGGTPGTWKTMGTLAA